MVETYKRGETPNPDVFCNKYVKFGGFLEFAIENGADYVSTGHYAQHEFTKEGSHNMLKTLDHNKDQTYFLWTMPQEKLQKILFPIGHLEKKKVRKLAEKYDLHNQDKKDSQGICFLGQVDMKEFLAEHVNQKPGKVLNENGEVIGSHPGVLSFTIGERHGFEIDPSRKTPDMPKLFVISKNIENNTITVGSKQTLEKKAEQNAQLVLEQCNWISGEPNPDTEYQGRIRYRGSLLPCRLRRESTDTWTATFKTPHSAVAIGQSAVFYDGDICIGGGVMR
jgi:tRNA-specific 2-thiouridylase